MVPIDRDFTLKGIGEVQVKAPRDRKNDFKIQAMTRSKKYEEEIYLRRKKIVEEVFEQVKFNRV